MLEDAGWGLRVSQDESGGSRHAVERQVVNALRHGDNVIVDRCNFDRAQRKHWIGKHSAQTYNSFSTDSYVLSVSED